jgi:hypothetical protein
MKLIELLENLSMSDIAEFWKLFQQVETASVEWDLAKDMLFIGFNLHGHHGTMRLRMRSKGNPQKTAKAFRSRLFAAATAKSGGERPRNWKLALKILIGSIRGRALALLTDTSVFELVRLRWRDYSVG